jgi:high affinity Mn2+ porin
MAPAGDRLTRILLIVLFILIVTRPAIAVRPSITEDPREVGDETSSNGLTEILDKGSEDMAGKSVAQPSWTSKLLGVELPRTAYEITEDCIPKLLGVQLPSWAPKLLGAQFTGIYQNMPAFHSPYQGEKSLRFDQGLGRQFTHSYGIYFGSQLTPSLQAYLDVEMFRGKGISKGLGLGGYMNGDVIRAGPANLPQDPYVARLYLRYLIPLSEERTGPEEPAMGQLPSPEPTSRIEIKLGKLAPTDDMDLNRYANNQRTQFLNYAFLFNTAWDYASDTRGFSRGFSVSLVKPSWRLTFGSYQVPKTANGYFLDNEIGARGDNLELTLKPNRFDTVIRLLAYHNVGRMGSYREALDIARATSTISDVHGDERRGRTKYGFGINLEQPLADNGETGVFARAGWSDGHTSAWSYTDVDRHISAGVQVSGIHWGRTEDRFGIAYGVNGLSSIHKRYLAAGGIGMLVGDERLNYGFEQVFEIYYRIQLGRYIQITPDFQNIWNPGYNRERGPAQVYGLRLHLNY